MFATPGVWVDRIEDVGRTYLVNIDDIDEAQKVRHREIRAESTRMALTCTSIAGNRAFEPYSMGGDLYLEAYARTHTCDPSVSGRRCRDGEGFYLYR